MIVRQKETRLTGGRVACTLVFDRSFTPEELARFYQQPPGGNPGPLDFFIEGRVARYECEADQEPGWRLAFEIYFVKAFRPAPPANAPSRDTGIRDRVGLRKLYLG